MLFAEGGFDALFDYLDRKYNDGDTYRLHYVTAREAYNIIKAAEMGLEGAPSSFRDFLVKPYQNQSNRENGEVDKK